METAIVVLFVASATVVLITFAIMIYSFFADLVWRPRAQNAWALHIQKYELVILYCFVLAAIVLITLLAYSVVFIDSVVSKQIVEISDYIVKLWNTLFS